MSTEEKTKTTSRAATRRKKLIGGLGAAVVLAAVVVTIVSVAGGSGSRSGTLINGVDYNLVRGANLVGANLSGANLTNVDLSGADLTNANLNNATLTGAKFGCITVDGAQRCANFTNLQASGIIGTPASLPTNWVLKSRFLLGPTVNLQSVSFYKSATLSGVNLTGANLRSANLRGADLSNSNLTNADLTGALANETTITDGGLYIPYTAFNGVTWNNTRCIDGNPSSYYNNTCVGVGYD